jgi:hypothetical protein
MTKRDKNGLLHWWRCRCIESPSLLNSKQGFRRSRMSDDLDYGFTDEEDETIEDDDFEDEEDEEYDAEEILPNGYYRKDYYDVGFSDGDIECWGLDQPGAPNPDMAGFSISDMQDGSIDGNLDLSF